MPLLPRAQDNWIVPLVAVGVLGGMAGWLGVDGFPPLANGQLALPQLNNGAQSALRSREPQADSLVVPEPQVPDSASPSHLTPVRPPLSFTDVPDDFWAQPYLNALTARGVLNGLPDGSFAPNRPLTRAELAVQVAQAFDIAAKNQAKSFSDVPPDYWAEETIQQSTMTGFMSGYPEGDFRPDQTVTRLEVLAALAAGLSLPETTTSQQRLQAFQDWEAIAPWARKKVAAAMQANIISPNPETDRRLRPNAPATRAEVAALIYAALVYMGHIEPLS
ncbi:MAG: S-layer homology domain-containing protein [Leptolyngbyaceae cyanobacterium]